MSGPDGMAAVDVGAIEDALAQRWRDHARTTGAALTHTCALTLLVWVEDEADGRNVLLIVQQLAGKHPIRAIVLNASETASEEHVSAWVGHGCEGPAGEAVCSEQIILRADQHASELLVSAVRGLLVSDLPVYLWWRSGSAFGNPVFAGLRKLADRIVVDSTLLGDGAAALDTLRRLVQAQPGAPTVRDVNWQRTEPWRTAIAACFDDDDILALLPRLNRCGITYASAGEASASARSLLLYGWLASRFAPLRGHGKIAPGKHWADVASGRVVAVTLTSSTCKSSLMLVRQPQPTGIAAEGHGPDGSVIKRWHFPAAARSEAQLLDCCIDAIGRDALFEAALGGD